MVFRERGENRYYYRNEDEGKNQEIIGDFMNKKELFISYIKANVAPILVDFIGASYIPNSVIIDSNISLSDLVGDKGIPSWYLELTCDNSSKFLVINNIDLISKNEQLKFLELLKDREIGEYKIPDNVVIIVCAEKINKDTINERIYSLVVDVRD